MRIKSIKKLSSSEHTWDISVEGNSQFFMSNGIVSHNSSSLVCGETSPSIEPFRSNAFVQKTLDGSRLVKNRFLAKLLKSKGKDTPEVWTDITVNKGSVQHLDFLDDWEKSVFKTAIEIDQRQLVDLAADRQKYICQSQSLNLFFTPDVNVKELHAVHVRAWKKGVKSLYYLRSEPKNQVEAISSKVERVIRLGEDEDICMSCEG